jgi:hypothetical protein
MPLGELGGARLSDLAWQVGKARGGRQCRSPAVKGKIRRRMHGGALGSGAPCGQRNGGWRHGGTTKATRAHLQELRAWVRVARTVLEDN